MYRIELLPSTSSHVTPGWTYVPDRGFDPAQAAITPTIGRKRAIRDGGRTDLSSRQSNAIIRHLAELDRENHRDVHIPIPVKQKDAARGTRGKTTSNVRRILQSQKTFRNYLDDEEAALAQAAQSTIQRPSISKITKPSRRSLTPAATPRSDSSKRKQSTVPPLRASTTPAEASTNATATPQDTDEDKKQPSPETEPENQNRLIKSEHDNDPLLKSYIPSAPSERIMQALLAEPPVTYNAARAGPPLTAKTPRHFCCMCGYWGKIRCLTKRPMSNDVNLVENENASFVAVKGESQALVRKAQESHLTL
ncbi:hypothetical protein CNMCM5793_004756 [Aspergillus hiratsukae]|uniref:HIT finger domain protein n=1 Tax=Aspergillus hiratsukae TaxID=1194566 RepID=A0A8H6Q7C5_9EURO|nr:hypothetical protein CNMCM5793_004756 [Aspergillus hiratsukae]KAF7167222.1 hypothetical protein CNMCM6106_002853 [Aspergillus hiratsukae]